MGQCPGFGHHLRGGLELRREWNDGPGYQFDMAFPPYVSWNGVNGYDRPRSYDEMPPIVASALYLDDRMSRRLFGDVVVNFQAGLRLDLLHDGGRVWLMTAESKLEIRSVTVKFRSRDRVLVSAGLEPGERLVATALTAPVDGMLLRTQADQAEASPPKDSPTEGRGQ